jgi:hypothetical protein
MRAFGFGSISPFWVRLSDAHVGSDFIKVFEFIGSTGKTAVLRVVAI